MWERGGMLYFDSDLSNSDLSKPDEMATSFYFEQLFTYVHLQ